MPVPKLLVVTLLAMGGLAACTPPAAAPAPVGADEAVPIPGPTVPGERPSAPPFPAPWPIPSDRLQRVEAAGLEVQPTESDLYHIHAHLDIFWDGQPTFVAANVGIDPNGIWISPLHTHGVEGILHVEAPKTMDITLGQFFAQWGVSLGTATVYDGGKLVSDGSKLVLRDMQDISVVYGTPPARIPVRYGPWANAVPTPAPAHPSATPGR